MGMLKFVFKNAVVLFLHLQLWNVFTVITVIKKIIESKQTAVCLKPVVSRILLLKWSDHMSKTAT